MIAKVKRCRCGRRLTEPGSGPADPTWDCRGDCIAAKPLKRTGLHKLACPNCGLGVYMTLASVERGEVPVCRFDGTAYELDSTEKDERRARQLSGLRNQKG